MEAETHHLQVLTSLPPLPGFGSTHSCCTGGGCVMGVRARYAGIRTWCGGPMTSSPWWLPEDAMSPASGVFGPLGAH